MVRKEQRQVMLPGELQRAAQNEPSAARLSSLVSSRIWCHSQTRGYSVFVLELLDLFCSSSLLLAKQKQQPKQTATTLSIHYEELGERVCAW